MSYAALLLFEPPLFQQGASRRVFELACTQAAARTRIRAARFASEEEFVDLMSAQPAMARLLPRVARLMARTTLRPIPAGGSQLRCPPDYEAKILASIPAFLRMLDPGTLPLPVKASEPTPT